MVDETGMHHGEKFEILADAKKVSDSGGSSRDGQEIQEVSIIPIMVLCRLMCPDNGTYRTMQVRVSFSV